MTGVELIAAERQRQVDVEGWSDDRDDKEHIGGGLVRAAICYAEYARLYGWHVLHPSVCARGSEEDRLKFYRKLKMPKTWPWAKRWWKPKDPVRDLVRAGALIAAEIDRLQRQERA